MAIVKKALVLPYTGLGDLISIKGLVRYLRQSYDEVVVATGTNGMLLSNYMYGDDDGIKVEELPWAGGYNVEQIKEHNVKWVEKFHLDGHTIIPLGNLELLDPYIQFMSDQQKCIIKKRQAHGWVYCHWFKGMYLSAGLSPLTSVTHSYVNRDLQAENNLYDQLVQQVGSKYMVVHDSEHRGLSIDISRIHNPENLPIVYLDPPRSPVQSDNIFHFCKILEKAEERHFICSSFAHIVDIMECFFDKLKYMHIYARERDPVQNSGGQADLCYYSPNWHVAFRRDKCLPLKVRPVNIGGVPELDAAYEQMYHCGGQALPEDLQKLNYRC